MTPGRQNNRFDWITRSPRKYLILGGIGVAMLIALKIISVIFHSTILIIHPGERGLLISLGKLQNTVLDEGAHLIMPLVTSSKVMNIRIQKTDIDSTARTQDLQRLTTKMVLNWKIDPLKVRDIYEQIGSEDALITKIITPIFDETVKASIPSRTLEKALIERDQLRDEITATMKQRLTPYGILVIDVSLINLTASDEFTQATEARQAAEQKAIADRIVVEQEIKKAELNTIKARKEAEALIVKAKSEAEAQKLLQQTLTSKLLQKQAIEKWDGQFPTVMGGNNTLPLINISPNAAE
jgi:regulator of protease activity HflC (stomatin/prohibitin superfamily)